MPGTAHRSKIKPPEGVRLMREYALEVGGALPALGLLVTGKKKGTGPTAPRSDIERGNIHHVANTRLPAE